MPRKFNHNGYDVAIGTIYVSKVYGEHPDGHGRRVFAKVGPNGINVDGKVCTSLPVLATACARFIATGKHDGHTTDPITGKVNDRNQGGTSFFAPIDTPENANVRSGWLRTMVEVTEGIAAPADLKEGEIIIIVDDSVTPRGKAATLPATKAETEAAITAEKAKHAAKIARLTAHLATFDANPAPSTATVPANASNEPAADPLPVATGKGNKGNKGKGK